MVNANFWDINSGDWSINRRNCVGGIAGHSNDSSDGAGNAAGPIIRGDGAGNAAGQIIRNTHASVQDVYDMVFNLCNKVKVLEVCEFVFLLYTHTHTHTHTRWVVALFVTTLFYNTLNVVALIQDFFLAHVL